MYLCGVLVFFCTHFVNVRSLGTHQILCWALGHGAGRSAPLPCAAPNAGARPASSPRLLQVALMWRGAG